MIKTGEISLDIARRAAQIPGVTIASASPDGEITSHVLGMSNYANAPQQQTIKPDTLFGAASLSKAAFTYLVLKLIDKEVIPKLDDGTAFDLTTPLYTVLPIETFYKDAMGATFNTSDIERAKSITVEMLLSHQSGISDQAPKLDFEPGTEFGYTGIGLTYLQKTIETLTGKNLEELAQKYLFQKPDGIGMVNSSFIPPSHLQSQDASNGPLKPPLAANSLYTTPSDYAALMSAWMHDSSEIMQSAFQPRVRMTKDKWAIALNVDEADLSHVAWGLGLGLELDDQGKPISAFHTGDMGQWRGWIAMDIQTKAATVYFANGRDNKHAYGHTLAEKIIPPDIRLEHAMNWFFKKYGFSRDLGDDWEMKEKENLDKIQTYLTKRAAERLPESRASMSSTTKILSTMKPIPKPKADKDKVNGKEEQKIRVNSTIDATQSDAPQPNEEESNHTPTPSPLSTKLKPKPE